MKEFLKFGWFKRECVKIQWGHGIPFADAHAPAHHHTRWRLHTVSLIAEREARKL